MRIRSGNQLVRSPAEAAATEGNNNDCNMLTMVPKDDDYQVVPKDDVQQTQIVFRPQDISAVPVPTPGCSSKLGMLPLLPVPDQQTSTPLVVLGGTAKAATGPPIGSVDIGIGESAYYFRVSLPGVKRDPGQLSCVIERSGRVQVRGMTVTGGETIWRESGVFTTKHQNLCSQGPFTLSFTLPGPVDPRMFSPNYREDAILEGVVVKAAKAKPGVRRRCS